MQEGNLEWVVLSVRLRKANRVAEELFSAVCCRNLLEGTQEDDVRDSSEPRRDV